MECACISANVDDESEVLAANKRLARKGHVCCECRQKIEPGEYYWNEKTLYDGRLDTYKTCRDCMSIRDHLICDFFYERIWETIQEFIDDCPEAIPWAKIGRLTPIARGRVCEMIENTWKEV